MKTTYMDYSATTYVKPEVLDAMMPFFTEKFGNPSSFYGISRECNCKNFENDWSISYSGFS